MPRRYLGRGLALRPVQTRKEIVDGTFLGVAGGTTTQVDLLTAQDNYVGGVGTVRTGAVVKAIYLFVQIVNESSSVNVDWYVFKKAANVVLGPVPGASGGDNERRFILHEEKGIPGSTTQGQGPLTFRGVIKIPPRMRRMGEDDRISIKLRGAQIHDICLKAIYKVYV